MLWKVELEMGAQAELSLGYFRLFPFQWAYQFHPAVPLEERERTYRDFFKRHHHPCCRSRYFDEKVWAACVTGRGSCIDIDASVARFKADKDLEGLIKTWGWRAFRYTNMITERLLALMQQSAKGDLPDAVRICGAGLLTQMMQEHKKLGRQSPKALSRKYLLDQGVPIHATTRARPLRGKLRKTGPLRNTGPFILYKKDMDNKRIKDGIHFNGGQHYKWLRSLSETFRKLPEERLLAYTQRSEHEFHRRCDVDACGEEVLGAALALEIYCRPLCRPRVMTCCL